eukprot:12092648-Ditylum_brightwellii.AAC.1
MPVLAAFPLGATVSTYTFPSSSSLSTNPRGRFKSTTRSSTPALRDARAHRIKSLSFAMYNAVHDDDDDANDFVRERLDAVLVPLNALLSPNALSNTTSVNCTIFIFLLLLLLLIVWRYHNAMRSVSSKTYFNQDGKEVSQQTLVVLEKNKER